MGTGAVRIIVDLVGLTDHEQSPVAQTEPTQAIRTDRFGGPLLHGSILFFHIEVEPGMRVDPIDLGQNANKTFLLVDVELSLHGVMGLRRRRHNQPDTEQSHKKRRLTHGFSIYFLLNTAASTGVIARLDPKSGLPDFGTYK